MVTVLDTKIIVLKIDNLSKVVMCRYQTAKFHKMLLRAMVKFFTTLFLFFICLFMVQAQSGTIDIDYQIEQPTACNLMDGAIHITPLSGVAPFEYSINGGASFQADSSFTNLGIGTYILLVRDAERKFTKFILAKLQADGSPVIQGIVMADPTECGIGGTLKILTEGGFGILEYSIDSGRTFQPDFIFTDVPNGLYHIIIRNEGGSCPSSYPPVSFAPQSPDNFITVTTDISQPNCDSIDGMITINVTGGSGDYLYSINGGTSFQSSNFFPGLEEGTYAILVRDTVSKCEKGAPQMVELMAENCMDCEAITIEYNKTDPDCNTATGQISVSVTGGSGNYLYSINDSVFQNASIFSELTAGDYTIKIRDEIFDCERSAMDTIRLNEVNCPNCDSVTLQSFLTFPTCNATDGRIELAVTGGSGDYDISLNGQAFQSNLVVDSLAAGTYTIMIRDNIANCEKAFSAITLSEQDCPCPLNLFTETEFSLMAPTCESRANLCLDVSLASLMKFEVLDNGVAYTGGVTGCEIDTMLTYLYFTLPGQGMAGPYRLDRWEVNDSIYTGEFQDIHELVDIMNQLDATANWERDSLSMTLKGGTPANSYGALEITQLATDMMGVLQLNMNFLPRNSQLSLTTGQHELIFKDPSTNCSDTVLINVDCPPCPEIAVVGSSIIQAMNCDTPALVCFTGADSLDLTAYTITDNGSSYMGIIRNCPDRLLGFELPLDTGNHQIIFENLDIDCRFVFDLMVTCQVDTMVMDTMMVDTMTTDTLRIDTTILIGDMDTICFTDYLMMDSITSIQPTCEGQSPAVGFEVNNLTNCLIYEGLMLGEDTLCLSVCENDTICKEIIITVTVDSMTMDTMMVDTMVMDTICESIFVEKNGSVQLMDCMMDGQYCLNILKSDLADYSLFINDSLFSGVFSDCDVPEEASLVLPIGDYQLILRENEGDCADTATLTIICEEEMEVFEDTVMVNETDTLCLDSLDLPFTIATIANVCEENSGERVVFVLDTVNHCLFYTGVEAGNEVACIEVCDSLDNCDTIPIIITVEEMPDTILPPIAVDDVDTLTEGTTKTINVLGNDTTNSTLITVVILEQPANGTATVNSDLTINYMANDGVCDTTDMFTYELCNPAGCDTATVTFYIECKALLIFNGFSPNGDAVNETFTIDGIEDFPNNTVQIFNRWGNMVFEQNGYKGQWNGTWNNKDLPDGTYFYLVDDGEGKQYSGFLEIRR